MFYVHELKNTFSIPFDTREQAEVCFEEVSQSYQVEILETEDNADEE